MAKLQDSAPPFDPKTAKETIEAELGLPTNTLFASFDLEPLAAASIGQAHAATLRDGAEVVVKVRRPGVVEQVEEDLEILQNLASAMSRRWEFAALYLARADYDQLVDALLEMGVATARVDRGRLRRDLENLISPYHGRPLGEIALTPLLNDALAVVRRHRMRLPSNLALLLKTIIVTEGLGARLDPDFCLLSVIEPYANRLLLKLYSPHRWVRKLKRAGLDMAWLGADAPQQLRRLIGAIERNGFEVGMRPESFEPLIKRLERIANRIVLGILAAAFISGLAALLSVYRPPGWENWAGVMFAAGFFFALALGIYLAWSILRSGRD